MNRSERQQHEVHVLYFGDFHPDGSIVGWPSGTSIDSQDTLSFSVLSGVRAMNEIFPLEQAAEAYDQMMSGRARFRAVLTTAK